MYPDIKILVTEPTRKDKILGKLASNFNHFSKAYVCHPIEGDHGQVSDHKIVLMEALLPRPKAFSWETHEYLQLTDAGCSKFKDLLEKRSG